jgi:hypothetical protein
VSSHFKEGGMHNRIRAIAEGSDDLVGKGATLEEAYADFAEKVARFVARQQGFADPSELPENYFDDKPIRTHVEVIIQPHNQWVKAYWVKAYGEGGS